MVRFEKGGRQAQIQVLQHDAADLHQVLRRRQGVAAASQSGAVERYSD